MGTLLRHENKKPKNVEQISHFWVVFNGCDDDGIRTHTPCSTTPSRWRVYQFLHIAVKKRTVFRLFVTRLGLEPRTPTLKVLCSTN